MGTAKAAAEEAHPEREEVEAGPVAREVEADQHDEEGKGPEEGVQPREQAFDATSLATEVAQHGAWQTVVPISMSKARQMQKCACHMA